MDRIVFLAELSNRVPWPPTLAIGSTLEGDREGNIISKFVTGEAPTGNYWTDWGGTYDNPTTPELELLFDIFLQRVNSVAELYGTENSYYVDGFTLYTNTTFYPWQYQEAAAEAAKRFGFSSIPPDELKPSDDRIQTETGPFIRYPDLLSVPSATLTNKLSDIVSGIVLSSTFNISLNNADGRFDDEEETNFFNTPISILKAKRDGDPKKRSDYNTIRYGLVDNTDLNTGDFNIKSASVYRTLNEEVCRTFSTSLYPTMPVDSKNIGKEVPILYDSAEGVPLFEVGTNLYVAVDSEYQTDVTAVYDTDGNSIAFTVAANGVITATGAKTADVSGLASCRIGQIITNEIAEKSNTPYVEGPWDKSETDLYTTTSPCISLYFTKGTVKSLIKKCLESDMAFLVEKNDGRLSLRRWSGSYAIHEIPSHMITKRPTKKHQEQKYFTSSVSIQYDYNVGTGLYERTELNASEETAIFKQYRKRQRLPFETLLTSQPDAATFSNNLLERFKNRSEIWSVDVGVDTAEMQLLDTVEMDIKVVDRVMSKKNTWKIIGVNSAQDRLTLESIEGFEEGGIYTQGVPAFSFPAFAAAQTNNQTGNRTGITQTRRTEE